MMKSNRIAVLVSFFLIGAVVRLDAATQPKFRSSGSADSGVGRYLVTLTAEADTADLAATKGELAALYGARLDPDAPAGIRQFTVNATAARARLMSSDPRVSEVTETPSLSPAPSAPTRARHFAPQTAGYGDNGQSGTYTYDGSGNITAIGTDTYLYDTENRLTTSVTRGVTETYTYDAFGNRKTATGATNCLGQTICAQPVTVSNSTNRLMTINGAAVHYDTPGNITGVDAITGSPTTIYTYDGTEMMNESIVGSDDRQYVYTADDERIAVKRGASWTWSVRDLNKKVLREFTSVENGANFAMTGRAWTKDYVWRDGLLLAATTSSGTLHYHLDHLGTPRLITDANAVKIAEHAYYPFGAEINLSPHENPEEEMKFTGHERDIVAGDGHTLDYMHARYYNANNARFLSVDPVLSLTQVTTSLQDWNRYTYVRNNPIQRIDADGRCSAPVGLRPGQVGICVASFIAAHHFKVLGLPGRGDNRSFNGKGGTSRIETHLIVDPAQHMVSKQGPDTIGRSGIIIKDFGPKGEGGSTISNVRADAAGTTHFGISQDAHSSYSFGGELLGSIDNHLKLEVTSAGKVGLESGLAKDFPSLEVYSYRVDARGTITTTSVITKVESDDIDDLNKPERPITPKPPQ